MSEKNRKPKTVVSDEAFVTAYASSKSSGEVARVLGVSLQTVFQRAKKLKESGVDLQTFSRKREIDVAGLNALIKSKAEADKAA